MREPPREIGEPPSVPPGTTIGVEMVDRGTTEEEEVAEVMVDRGTTEEEEVVGGMVGPGTAGEVEDQDTVEGHGITITEDTNHTIPKITATMVIVVALIVTEEGIDVPTTTAPEPPASTFF